MCLPTVFSASENFAANSSSSVDCCDARTQPIAGATRSTSSTVLLTRTKNVTLMSARMLSVQIRPSLPLRAISIVLTERSMTSALLTIGSTIAPVNVTSGSLPILLTIIAWP